MRVGGPETHGGAIRGLVSPSDRFGAALLALVDAAEEAYLATPNVGVLGSHGAAATALLATLLAWGHEGVAQRIEHCMNLAR